MMVEQEIPIALIFGRRQGTEAVVCFRRGDRERYYAVSSRRYRALIEWSMSRKNVKLTGDWMRNSFRWYVWPLKVRAQS